MLASLSILCASALFSRIGSGAVDGRSHPGRSGEIAAELSRIQSGLIAGASANPTVATLILMTTWTGSSCPSFKLVEDLNRCAGNRQVDAVVVLPEEFTDGDLRNYKANLGLEVSVVRADPALSRVWRGLAGRFGKGALHQVLVLVTRHDLRVLRNPAEIRQSLSRVCGGSNSPEGSN